MEVSRVRRPFPLRRYVSRFGKSYLVEMIAVPLVGTVAIIVISFLPVLNHSADKFLWDSTYWPPWPFPILVGLISSVIRNRQRVRFPALLAWLLPTLRLLGYLVGMWTEAAPYYSRQEWKGMFAHTCEGEGCVNPIFVCVPVAFSASYSVAALILWLLKRNKLKAWPAGDKS